MRTGKWCVKVRRRQNRGAMPGSRLSSILEIWRCESVLLTPKARSTKPQHHQHIPGPSLPPPHLHSGGCKYYTEKCMGAKQIQL